MDNLKKNDVIDMHGYVTRNLYNERGELIESHNHENLIVNSGKSRIIRNIFDGTDIRLVGCMIGRDVNSPMNLTNDSGWVPTDPKPTDTKATIGFITIKDNDIIRAFRFEVVKGNLGITKTK